MANEIKTTNTTNAGLVERVQADAIATVRMQSRLFNFVNTKEAMNAGSVQFWSPDTPSGVIAQISAQTESNSLTSLAHSATARAATLYTYAWQTSVSELDLRSGSMTEAEMARNSASYVAGAIDKAICAQFSNFTPTISGATFSVSNLLSARAQLENTGFAGNVICVLGVTEFGELMSDALTAHYTFQKNDQIISNGYMGRLFDIDIIAVPDTYLPTIDSQKYGAMFFDGYGIGLGYHAPLIEVKQTPLDIANFYMGAKAEVGATYISAYGGVKLQS